MDILIVGAGPTGLFMALELKRHGLKPRIIDKLATPSTQSKALAIQPRTLEILHFLNIAESFLDKGVKLKGAIPHSRNKSLAYLSFEQLDSPFPFILSLEQSKTEEILNAHLNQMGIQVEREVELMEIQEDKQGVQATLFHQKTKKRELIQASWVIGCDGAHSLVRKSLHLPFKGKLFSDIFSLADVHVQWKHPHDTISTFLEPSGVVAAFPLPSPNRYRLIFQLKRCRHALNTKQIPSKSLVSSDVIPDPTLEETEEIVRRCADPNAIVSDPIWLANFHINSRLASQYKIGRIFLAGDAAHIHSPVGGQGMNTGFQDAFNLAWKLALVHTKKVPSAFLNSYHDERHDVAERLLKATERASKGATVHNPVLISIRNLIASFLLKLHSFRKKLQRSVAQLSLCYPKSTFIKEDGFFKKGPKAGCRAPNATLVHENTQTTLFDLWKSPKNYFLLLFNPDQEFIDHLPSFEYCIPIIISKEDEAFKIYRIMKDGAYIIRPDTYIGYRQSSLNLAQIQAYFSEIFPRSG